MHTIRRLARSITCPDTGRVYPVPAGGSTDDPPAAPPADPPADDDPPADNDPPADPDPDPDPDDGDGLPEWARKQLKKARDDAAGYRTKLRDVEAKQQQTDDVLGGIAKALGLTADDTPDPDQLQAQLQQRDNDLKTKTIELAVYRQAAQAEASPDALLDSRSFIDKAATLDPTADDFATQLDAAIEQAVEANPTLKARQAQASGSSDAPSKPPADKPRPEGLRGALAAHIGEQ